MKSLSAWFKRATHHARVVWQIVKPIVIETVVRVAWDLLVALFVVPEPEPRPPMLALV